MIKKYSDIFSNDSEKLRQLDSDIICHDLEIICHYSVIFSHDSGIALKLRFSKIQPRFRSIQQ